MSDSIKVEVIIFWNSVRYRAGPTGFHSPVAALILSQGGYFGINPPRLHPGLPAVIPLTRPPLLVAIFNGDLSGVWVRRWAEWKQRQGILKMTAHHRPLRGAGRGQGPEAPLFCRPVGPITNSSPDARLLGYLYPNGTQYRNLYPDLEETIRYYAYVLNTCDA